MALYINSTPVRKFVQNGIVLHELKINNTFVFSDEVSVEYTLHIKVWSEGRYVFAYVKLTSTAQRQDLLPLSGDQNITVTVENYDGSVNTTIYSLNTPETQIASTSGNLAFVGAKYVTVTFPDSPPNEINLDKILTSTTSYERSLGGDYSYYEN